MRCEMLSVQVHPWDAHPELLPAGETGKTEAWDVVEAGEKSRIYAGLKPGTTTDNLRRAIAKGTMEGLLEGFTPKPGEAIFLPAGTVHSLGKGVVVFEVQQNSDVTFRLYDWDRVDPKDRSTASAPGRSGAGKHRYCTPYSRCIVTPVLRVCAARETFDCAPFCLWRLRGRSPFNVGAEGAPQVLIGIEGTGQIECEQAALCGKKRRCLASAGEHRSVCFRPDSASELVGDRPAGLVNSRSNIMPISFATDPRIVMTLDAGGFQSEILRSARQPAGACTFPFAHRSCQPGALPGKHRARF